MGVPYFAPYIPSPEGRGFTARVDNVLLSSFGRCSEGGNES